METALGSLKTLAANSKADFMLSLIYSSHLRTPRPDHPGIGEEQVILAYKIVCITKRQTLRYVNDKKA